MVVVKETTGMFWGVTLDTGKRYTQTVERSFHISMAALEPKQAGGANANVCVMLQHEKSDYLMCTLSQNRPYQQELDLNFTQGEEVTFYLNGTGIVHLTGYLMDEGVLDDTMDRDRFGSDAFEMTGEFSDEDSDDESDEDDDDDDSELDSEPETSTAFGDLETTQSTDEDDADWTEARKRKLKHALRAAKKIRTDGAQDDEDDDDDDSMDKTSSTMDTSQFSDEEDESDEESETTPVTTPSKKGGQNKKQAKQQAAKLAASGGKANQAAGKQNSQTQSSKKAKGQTPKGQTPKGQTPKGQTPKGQSPKGQTPKAEVKLEQKSPKSAAKSAKKGGEKGKAKSEPPTPSVPKGGRDKTPKVENGPAKATQADGSPDQSPGLSKSAKKRQKQKEKKRLSLAEASKSPETPVRATANPTNARVLTGGTAVVDDVVGHGPEAAKGQMLSVYYSGKVSTKVTSFDKCLSGKPFKFRLGKAEVIPGWETGLQGMKVGGKRTIIVPPSQAYGSTPNGEIPANSTLVFNVQLKAVS